MAEVVFYRKYRPASFAEVRGQEHITRVLESAIAGGQPAHAYLFYGSRGTGKTSVARILSRGLKVSENDLYEIDGASNRGIDEVRALREAVRTLPFDSAYKMYVIDEAHMLTKDAFNALLKTLEEPPSHVIFVLATTELHKIPETVLSRCQSFSFRKPSEQILKETILDIAKVEKAHISLDAASLIAFLGEGSFRDAEGILEQVLTLSGKKKVERADVEDITGAPKNELVKDVIGAFLDGEKEKGITAIHKAVRQNNDMKIFTRLIMKYIRYGMLLSFAPNISAEIKKELSNEEFAYVETLAKHKNAVALPNILKTLLEAYERIMYAHVEELPLELALVKIIGQDSDTK